MFKNFLMALAIIVLGLYTAWAIVLILIGELE